MNPLKCAWQVGATTTSLGLHMRAMGLGDETAPASDHPVSSGVGLGIRPLDSAGLGGGEKETEGRANVVSGTQESTGTREVLTDIKSFPLELRGTSAGCSGRLS